MKIFSARKLSDTFFSKRRRDSVHFLLLLLFFFFFFFYQPATVSRFFPLLSLFFPFYLFSFIRSFYSRQQLLGENARGSPFSKRVHSPFSARRVPDFPGYASSLPRYIYQISASHFSFVSISVKRLSVCLRCHISTAPDFNPNPSKILSKQPQVCSLLARSAITYSSRLRARSVIFNRASLNPSSETSSSRREFRSSRHRYVGERVPHHSG